MGKVLKDIPNDVEALAQWVKRKLTNHDPMSERTKGKGGNDAVVSGSRTDVTYQLSDGRVFEISVREINPDQGHKMPMVN